MWTEIATAAGVAFVSVVVPALAGWAIYEIKRRVADRDLAQVLETAVNNGVGVIQQVTAGASIRVAPSIAARVPETLAPGVQYVVNHAGEAVDRFNQSPEQLAEKLVSRIGLKEIENNIAISASATPQVAAPLAPSPSTWPCR